MKGNSFLQITILCLSVLSVYSCSSKEAWKPSIEYTDAPWELPDGGIAEPVNVYRGNPSRDGVITKEPIEYFRQFEPIEALRGNVYHAAQYGDMIAYAAQEKQEGVWGDLTLFLYDQRQRKDLFAVPLSVTIASIELTPGGVFVRTSDKGDEKMLVYNYQGEISLDLPRVLEEDAFSIKEKTGYLLGDHYVAILNETITLYRLSDGKTLWENIQNLYGGRNLLNAGDTFYSIVDDEVLVFDPKDEKVWTIEHREDEIGELEILLTKEHLVKNGTVSNSSSGNYPFALIYDRSGELQREIEGVKIVAMIGDVILYNKAGGSSTEYHAETLDGAPLWQKTMDALLYVDEAHRFVWGGYNEIPKRVELWAADTGEQIDYYYAQWQDWGSVAGLVPVDDEFFGFSEYPPQIWSLLYHQMSWVVEKEYYRNKSGWIQEYSDRFLEIFPFGESIIARGSNGTHYIPRFTREEEIVIHDDTLMPYSHDGELRLFAAMRGSRPTIVKPLAGRLPLEPQERREIALDTPPQVVYGDVAYILHQPDNDTLLRAQDLADGAILWEKPLAKRDYGDCPFYNKKIRLFAYPLIIITDLKNEGVSCDHSMTQAFDARDGSLLWTMSGRSDAFLHKGTVYLYNYLDASVKAMDVRDLKIKWSRQYDSCTHSYWFDDLCDHYFSAAFFADTDNELLYGREYVVDMASGRKVRRHTMGEFGTELFSRYGVTYYPVSPQAISDGILFRAVAGNTTIMIPPRLQAFDSVSGALLWEVTHEDWGWTDSSGNYTDLMYVTASNGKVLVSTYWNEVYAFDVQDGSFIWDYNATGYFSLDKTIVSGNMVHFVGEEERCWDCDVKHVAFSLDIESGLLVGFNYLGGPFADFHDDLADDFLNIDQNVTFSEGRLYHFKDSVFIYE